MASKGAITITQDELVRMKMRANVIPNCTFCLKQPNTKIIKRNTNINRVKSGLTNGSTTPKTSKNAKKKKGFENSKKKNSNADALMKKNANFSKK